MEDSRSRKPPGTVPAVDNRLEPRHQVKPVEYIELGENNGGIILNVSEHGTAVSAAQPLGGDQTLRLRFRLPGFPSTIETVGEISWIGESKRRTGIRFVDLPERAREQIRKWISLQATASARDEAAPEMGLDPDPPIAAISEQGNRPNPARNRNADERRSQVRKSVNASAYLRLSDGNVGLVANVSETGLSFRAAKTLESERIFVRFQLPDSDQFIESPALIVWKSASKKKVGARFVNLPGEAREQIVQWIGSRTAPKSTLDPREQSRSVRKTSEVSASPTDLNWGAKPEEGNLPPDPPAHAEHQLPAFLEPRTPFTPDRHLGVPVSEASASDVAFDSGLPTFYRASPLNVAPKESSNFWKIATLIVVIGGACFGGGIYFSRSRQISASSYENVNQGLDTSSARQSSQSELSTSDSGTKPSSRTQAAATHTEGSGRVMRDADKQPADKPFFQRPQSKQLVNPRDSGRARSDVPVADQSSAQSGRRTASTEPANTRGNANNFLVPGDTRPANQGAAVRQQNALSPGARETSKLESEANARLNQESKPAAVSEPPQPHVASNPPALDSSATIRVPSTAASNPTASAPFRNLVPSVSFFSRFRSIRTSGNGSNLSASGELQIGSLRSSVVPAYPVEAQQRQVQGVVELDVMVGSAGEVQSVRLVKGPAELAKSAIDAVRSWQFAPTLLAGHPVETEQSVIFTFKLAS
jgi:TonB family protein